LFGAENPNFWGKYRSKIETLSTLISVRNLWLPFFEFSTVYYRKTATFCTAYFFNSQCCCGVVWVAYEGDQTLNLHTPPELCRPSNICWFQFWCLAGVNTSWKSDMADVHENRNGSDCSQ